MKTMAIADAAFGTWSPTTTSFAVRLRQCTDPAKATCAAVRRAVSDRKEALEQRLQAFVLELLAAIVLFAIFMIVTEPETQADPGDHSSHQSDS
jgi:hypothetical protein